MPTYSARQRENNPLMSFPLHINAVFGCGCLSVQIVGDDATDMNC